LFKLCHYRSPLRFDALFRPPKLEIAKHDNVAKSLAGFLSLRKPVV
jgi:hypothetical protein